MGIEHMHCVRMGTSSSVTANNCIIIASVQVGAYYMRRYIILYLVSDGIPDRRGGVIDYACTVFVYTYSTRSVTILKHPF